MNESVCEAEIFESMEARGYPAVLIGEPSFLTCLADLEFPFAEHYPEKPVLCIVFSDTSAVLFVPAGWASLVREEGWKHEIITYSEGEARPFELLAERTAKTLTSKRLSGSSIGVDAESLPAGFCELLEERISPTSVEYLDREFFAAGQKKTSAQLERLKTAAEQVEFGIIAALHHLEGSLEDVGYTASEFCERIRVHIYEANGTAGGLACTANGENTTQWYGLPKGWYATGEFVRIEASSRYRGYWANTARMISIGPASSAQKRAFKENSDLKNFAKSLLQPGVRCSSVYRQVEAEAENLGVDLRPEFGVGHGIGVREREAPYLIPEDDTTLQEGMCIVLTLYTEGPQKELICSKDTYHITADGPACISAHYNWNSVYEVTGFRSAH